MTSSLRSFGQRDEEAAFTKRPASRVGAYPGRNGHRTHRPRLARYFTSAAKQGHGRNAADIEALRQALRHFCIHLHQAGCGFQHSSRLFEFGSHRPAGPAPWSPEIDHHREIVGCDMPLEPRFIQFDRVAVEQGLMAVATARPRPGALCRHAIGGIAVRTDDMKRITHGAFLTKSFVSIEHGAAWPKTKGPAQDCLPWGACLLQIFLNNLLLLVC